MKTKDANQVLNNGKEKPKTVEEIDASRLGNIAYSYLCHLEAAKKWIEVCIREKLPPTVELEENLRNGVYLAKLGNFMSPEILPLHKIYDAEQKRYAVAGLQFKHTDNINYFLKCLKSMNLPLTFQPETTDIYDKKNMPRLIYCIHALSTHLFKLGKAPQMQDFYGKINFTDAEIDAVNEELNKCGLKLPSFQKIGGLLNNCASGDTNALHAAIKAVNDCLLNQTEDILPKLQDLNIHLQNVNSNYADFYYEALLEAKELKCQAALNRSLNDSYIPDMYDELLTQAEIQGHINNVNFRCALENLIDAVHYKTANVILPLKNFSLNLDKIDIRNDNLYKEELNKLMSSYEWEEIILESYQYIKKKLQNVIDMVNERANYLNKKQEVVHLLNKCLNDNCKKNFYEILLNPALGISNKIDEFAVPLYYEEMKIDRMESKNDLSFNDIVVSVRVLSCIASISKAVDTNNHELVFQALKHPDAHVMNLDEFNKVKYYQALATVRNEKLAAKEECSLLTYIDIQECIDLVNQQCMQDMKIIDVLKSLNVAVNNNCRNSVLDALKQTSLKLEKPTLPENASLYLKLFRKCLQEKHDDGSELWLDDVEEVTNLVALESENVQTVCTILAQINIALERDDAFYTIDCLQSFGITLPETSMFQCYKALRKLKKYKEENYSCPYVKHVTSYGNEAVIDLKKFNYTWDHPKNLGESCYISKQDIDNIIKSMSKSKNVFMSQKKFESLTTQFQAHVRGYLIREKVSEKLENYRNNIDKIILIQSWWRKILARKHYIEMLNNKQSISKVTNSKCLENYYKQNEAKIIKIQALWRGYSARKNFLSLLCLEKPPYSVVKHFSSIINFDAKDYEKDLELQQVKNEVVQLIKHNQDLSQQLNNMDIKIGLLIQNRIALSDVIDHGKKLENLANKEKNTSRVRKNSFSDKNIQSKGLRSLTKDGRRMLEGYQHLFYALQTNPVYLSKLLFLLPQSKSNKFLQNVILTLFNFGSSLREEYLLLKLLGTALKEEIRSKFQKPSEVVTGNPLVLKMTVNYARQLNGQNSLREILSPTIKKILADKSITIETNPVDIYKAWRNQLEMETGETLDLPYTVSQQQALQYEQVKKRLNNGIQILKTTVTELLNRITSSRDLIPYGMLYMAKVLNDTLREKFPNAPEKDILKVIGNLIYYHYINAAIVAPDAFDIINLSSERSLSNDQRRNLASIAKILQFAASKKGFGEEATHLVCLNPFIIECHEKFKIFFSYCCQIEELEKHFNIHEYTEATLIQKPEITISLQEICDTHGLVLEYQDQIAPDPLDPLHELLEDLGSAPTVASLLGLADSEKDACIARYGKTDVCLVLNNKFEVPDTDDSNLGSLFIKTKEQVVSVMKFFKGDNLVEALESMPSPLQEKLYNLNRFSLDSRNQEIHSLNECKLKLRSNLNKLELGGWVSRDDDYQTIVTAIAKDLRFKSQYRQLRSTELQTLKTTKQTLEEKSDYYKKQVEYYNEYIKRCLENLNKGKGSYSMKRCEKNNEKKLKSKVTLKYSAAKLQEKGVIKEIEGLPAHQFKNTIFEISPTEHTGVFHVNAKFMGIQMEKIDIDIQRLLELQFEGSPIMDMFGRAKVNVNLLLYLLNKKFYCNKN